jgi:hypothetical protein
VSCLIVVFIGIGILIIALGFSAYLRYSTFRYINPFIAILNLNWAIGLGLGGILLLFLSPVLYRFYRHKTGPETDEFSPDGMGELPELSTSPATFHELENDSMTVLTRTGESTPLPSWLKKIDDALEDEKSSNEEPAGLPQLSLEELAQRLKGLEIRVGKLRKRVLTTKTLEQKDFLDLEGIEAGARACLLEALEAQHGKGVISNEFYKRKSAQLKPDGD